MKPPSFAYHRPGTLREAVAVLAEVGAEGKVLAGGQSLVPLLNMRLAAPAHLVDINFVPELRYVRVTDGAVRVGALARHSDVERDAAAYEAIPLLRRATRTVAHPAIRNRGTTVGSVVHADPAAELPAVLVLLGGEVELASAAGRRRVPAGEFFLGPLTSAIGPDEVAVEVTFPVPPPGTGSAWLEVSRRAGDYALAGVGVTVTAGADRRIVRAGAACAAVGDVPVPVDLTAAMAGQPLDAADWAGAAALVGAAVDPEDDLHATAAYRRHLVTVLAERAGRAAALEAG